MAYSDFNQMYLTYGKDNVEKWADLNNDDISAEITNVMNFAIAKADRYIDARLRDSKYVVPFAALPSTPDDIQDISAAIAGHYLFIARRIGDEDEETNKNMILRAGKDAFEKIQMILRGQYKLDLPLTDITEVPVVVKDD